MPIRFTVGNELSIKADVFIVADSSDKIADGEIVITKGSMLQKYIIMVGVFAWIDGEYSKEETLRQVCGRILTFVKSNDIKSIAFDVHSFNINNHQFTYVANVLIDGIIENFDVSRMKNFDIILCQNTFQVKHIDDFERYLSQGIESDASYAFGDPDDKLKPKFDSFVKQKGAEKPFRDHLLDLINKKGFTKFSDVYKAAGISKYVFSKIMNYKLDPPHKPSKDTVAALSIGLKLDIREAEGFYNVAGYHLGYTELVDKVIRFFIGEGVYDIDEVTYCLDYHGHSPLGDRIREV